jgi:hypothetical protein
MDTILYVETMQSLWMLIVVVHIVTTELWRVNYVLLRSIAYTVFEFSKSGNIGSYPNRGMHVEYGHVSFTSVGSRIAGGPVRIQDQPNS